MCGLAGVMMRAALPPDPALLERLAAAIGHRGPDAQGTYVSGDVALVHARLSIIDLVTGDQPLFGPGGTALVANGEIYNDPELRRDFAGVNFATRSDCEPILHLYVRFGLAFAERLRGMYAVALHDPGRNRLVLARDPFGIKPLYYAETEDRFAFASEPAALLTAGIVRAEVDPRRRAELLQLKFTTGEATIFPGIRRLLPGETIAVECGRIVERHRRAALPEGAPLAIGHADALRRVEQVLLDTVSAHLRSDVPYGLFLSGGIDSAALLGLMRQIVGDGVRAITVGYPEAGDADESREAERLARAAGARYERIEMSGEDWWRLAPRIAAALDDPTTDAAALPTYMLGRAAAADRLKVTLCGEGGDEMFGGYSRYRRARPPLAWFGRKPRTRGVFGAAPAGLAHWRDGIAAAERSQAAGERSAVQRLQAIDCAEWLPNDLLIKLDRCLMAHGVEGRTPFLDPGVADFAFRLPDGEKVGLRTGKMLLRAWLARAFPPARAWARKQGFKPPVGRWIAARGEALVRQVAASPAIAPVFDPAAVGSAFSSAADDGQPAWSMLFYALWHARHIQGVPADGDVGEVLAAAAR